MFAVVSLIAVLVMVIGCAAPPAAPAPAQPAPTQAARAKLSRPRPAEAPAASGCRMSASCRRRLTSPFHVAMVDGATAKSKELGWKLDVQAPA